MLSISVCEEKEVSLSTQRQLMSVRFESSVRRLLPVFTFNTESPGFQAYETQASAV